jgi:hypothetical protein
MKKKCLFIYCVLLVLPVFGQDAFVFEKGIQKVTVPIHIINNLVFIPLKVNGIELNFLLDSGVEETILFSLDDNPNVKFYNSQKIALKGLGSDDAIEGLKTTNNFLEIPGLTSSNQLIYVILDQKFNLSSHIGIPVNGIIGYNFFRDNLIQINYASKKLIIHKSNSQNLKKINKKFKKIPITIERNKPYLQGEVFVNELKVPVKLLIDIGNSDSIWLFENLSDNIRVPDKNFDDFLGKGFSGDIIGKRAKVGYFSFDKYYFKQPIVAFPDSISLKSVRLVKDRLGSVGGGIFKRFSIILDYNNKNIYLKKNSHYNDPFTYNESGVEIQHNGLQWVQETVMLNTTPINSVNIKDNNGENIKISVNNTVTNDFKYKFELKPIYEISKVRVNSPAYLSGLREGDIVITINKKPAYKYSLGKITEMFRTEEGKWVTLEIERNSQAYKFKFQLIDVL